MESSKNDSEKNKRNSDKEIKNEKDSKSISSDSKNNEDIEYKINAMLDKVMEEQDNIENNNNQNKGSNSLKFNDDEENEENPLNQKINQDNYFQNFDRGNKRLKTVNNYPVNIPNMPIMNLNKFNLCNNNLREMRTPSFGYLNYNKNYNLENNNNSNNLNQNYINNNSINNNPYNSQIYNNSNANYIRNSMPYSKTAIYHYPLNLFNMNFPINNYNFPNFNINNNYPNNFQKNISQNNNNITQNKNNNDENISKSGYKRKESRRRTCPSLNCAINEMAQQDFQNYNKNNPLGYNNEYLIFQLKFNLERTGKIDHYIYNLVKGKFLNIIKSQKGSKIFQKYLKTTHCDILHQIFLELNNNLEELITDNYANYFCKRFFTYLSQKDRIDFLKQIENSIATLSSNSIGTYPIQTIIEHVGSKIEKVIIISAIKEHIKELSVDPFGSHVLEKLLACFEEEFISFLYDYISDNFLTLAYNNNGICIVKKLVSFTHKKYLHDKIKILIKDNALQFIEHPYANFVIQVVIECWSDYKEILDLFDKKYYRLSLEKYASNVVERCIERDENILNNYIDEIINSKCIYEVMRSNFGNYVIQKAIKLSKGESKNKLIFNAAKDINKLNDGKLIIKWKSILSPHLKELSSEQIDYLKEQKFFT